MAAIDLSCAGDTLILSPRGMTRDEIQQANSFAVRNGAALNSKRRDYTLRIADLPALARAATVDGITLHPCETLSQELRAMARALRMENDFLASVGAGLYPFQREGVAFLHGGRTRLLFDEMGIGKTIQALCAIERGSCALVICPKVLRSNWATECARWRGDLVPVIINRRSAFRWPEPGECVIINYDLLPEDFTGTPAPGTHLICDEAQAIKSYKAKRTQAVRKIVRRIFKADGCAWLLTGTPLLNRPNELWAMLQALQLGSKLYGDYYLFVKQFGGTVDGLGIIEWDSSRVAQCAMDPIRPYALRRTRAEVLPDLPTKTYRSLAVEATIPRLRTADDAILSFDNIDDLMAHMSEDAGMMADRKLLAASKIPALLQLVQTYEDASEPVVVFSAHRAPIEALAERQGWRTIMGGTHDRQGAVDAFQAGKLAGLGCTIRAAGVGLTLTRASHVIFVDQDWVPAINAQAEDRVCRIGQTRGVVITVLVADHELDKAVSARLLEKQQYAAATVSQLDSPNVLRDRLAEAMELERLADEIDGS